MTLGVIDITDRPVKRGNCPKHGDDVFQTAEPRCSGCIGAQQFRRSPEGAMARAEAQREAANAASLAARAARGLPTSCEFEDDGSGIGCVKCHLPELNPIHRKPAGPAQAAPGQPGRDTVAVVAEVEAPTYFLRSAPGAQLPASVAGTVLGRMAAAIEESWGTPGLFSAMVGLGVVCASTRGRQELQIGSGERFPVSLYLAPLSPPGSMKTRVLSVLKEPLAAAQRKQAEGGAVQRQKLEAYIAAAGQRRDAYAKAVADRKDSDVLNGIEDELKALHRKIDDLRKSLAAGTTVVFGGDLTAEALAKRAAANLGPVSVLSAEGVLIENLAGRYNDGAANTEFVNSAYDCEEYTRERSTTGSQQIERPWLSLMLAVQPDVLSTILGSSQMHRRGFMQRIWFASVPHAPYRPRHELQPVAEDVVHQWAGRIRGVWAREAGVLLIEGEAAAPLDGFDDRVLVPRIAAAAESGDDLMMGWLAKAGMTAKRLAAAMQLLEDPRATSISVAVARAAADLAELLVEHNEHLFTGSVQMINSSPRSLVLDYLSDSLRINRQNPQNPGPSGEQGQVVAGPGGFGVVRKGLIEVLAESADPTIHAQNRGSGGFGGSGGWYVTSRTVWKRFEDRKWCRSATDVKAVLSDLAAMGWLDGPFKPPSGAKGGRPAELWQLHPELRKHWSAMMSGPREVRRQAGG